MFSTSGFLSGDRPGDRLAAGFHVEPGRHPATPVRRPRAAALLRVGIGLALLGALAGVGLILAASGFGRLFSLALIAILLADLNVCWLMVELRRRR